ACARAPVGAGAVRAPDCPGVPVRASRTQGAERTSPVCFEGIFFAPAPTRETGQPPDRSVQPNIAQDSDMSSNIRNITDFLEQILLPILPLRGQPVQPDRILL
ncbi:MAG: hypothetical protein OXG99_05770, partial [Alphaproteobacteria bacterium]|nr:hypothetical protein [Alphaproteobacteria bacterium]